MVQLKEHVEIMKLILNLLKLKNFDRGYYLNHFISVRKNGIFIKVFDKIYKSCNCFINVIEF